MKVPWKLCWNTMQMYCADTLFFYLLIRLTLDLLYLKVVVSRASQYHKERWILSCCLWWWTGGLPATNNLWLCTCDDVVIEIGPCYG